MTFPTKQLGFIKAKSYPSYMGYVALILRMEIIPRLWEGWGVGGVGGHFPSTTKS